jgi:hypothetical protein
MRGSSSSAARLARGHAPASHGGGEFLFQRRHRQAAAAGRAASARGVRASPRRRWLGSSAGAMAWPARGRQRQLGGPPLSLAAQGEHQGHQTRTAASAGRPCSARQLRPFARHRDGADAPSCIASRMRMQPGSMPPLMRRAGGRFAATASGRRRLNSAPPLGWLAAVNLPPWRSTMP